MRTTNCRVLLSVFTWAIVLTSAASAQTTARNDTPTTRAQDSRTTSTAATGAQVVRLKVEGMSCMACVAQTKKALSALEGVKSVEVSLEKRGATVEYDARRVTPETLVRTINDLGYRASAPEPSK